MARSQEVVELRGGVRVSAEAFRLAVKQSFEPLTAEELRLAKRHAHDMQKLANYDPLTEEGK